MSNPIPLSAQKRLLRLISARTDMMYADDAFRHFMLTSDESARHHLFLAMVLAYCRPFTENYGIGSLRCEYPAFPDFPDADMNLRHKRFLDLRNKLLGHSSIEGTKVYLLAPGSVSPANGRKALGYGYAVEKLVFSEEPAFVSQLHDLVIRLLRRLHDDIRLLAREVGSNHLQTGEIYQIETGSKAFQWTE
ncbi:MAG: hypothetical protein ACLQM8_09445 [Limisphaerales bacterium]